MRSIRRSRSMELSNTSQEDNQSSASILGQKKVMPPISKSFTTANKKGYVELSPEQLENLNDKAMRVLGLGQYDKKLPKFRRNSLTRVFSRSGR